MKTILLALLLSAFPALAGETYFREPIRLFDGRTADLRPVFQWWLKAEAITQSNRSLQKTNRLELPPRPMPAWELIQGPVVEGTAAGWEVAVEVSATPGETHSQKIFLRHPLQWQKDRVEQLAKQIAELQQTASREHSAVIGAIEDGNKYRERAMNAEIRIVRDVNDQRATGAAQAYARHSLNSAQASSQLAAVRAELEKYPSNGRVFVLDHFALRTGETFRGLPVYDLGFIPPRK